MPVNALPIITEGRELDSTIGIIEDNLTLSAKTDIYETSLHGQLLPKNEHPQGLAVINIHNTQEDTLSNIPENAKSISHKPDDAVSHKTEEEVLHKPEKSISCTLEETLLHKLHESISCTLEEILLHKSEEYIPHVPKITVSCPQEDSVSFKSEGNISQKLKDADSCKPEEAANNAQIVLINEDMDTIASDKNTINISKLRCVQSTKSSRKSQPWETKLTKKELDALLPRKSFFSCHDKALRDAGYIPEEIEKRNLERKEKRKIFRDKLFKTRCGQNNIDNNNATFLHKDPNDTLLDSDVKDKTTPRARNKHDDLPKVEHKALTEYLRYVKENTNEYLEYLSRIRKTSCEDWVVRNLIKTAMVFQKGHHGVPYTTPTVRASHTLSPRFADPGLWQQLNKELTSRRLITMDSSISKLSIEKEKDTKLDSDDQKTDYEKVLSRAEKWAKTVSTAQFLRARQEALKEVEEEDTDVTKWWINMKKCNYIRNNTSTSD